jgi:hypothetical protein
MFYNIFMKTAANPIPQACTSEKLKRVYQYTKKTGRPMAYTSSEELSRIIELYFDTCDRQERPYTVSGLAFAVGMTRDQLIKYQERPEFMDTIKYAKQKVAVYVEEQLYRKSGSVTGIIFSLKNNFGWKDTIETVNKNLDMNDLLKKIEDSDVPLV